MLDMFRYNINLNMMVCTWLKGFLLLWPSGYNSMRRNVAALEWVGPANFRRGLTGEKWFGAVVLVREAGQLWLPHSLLKQNDNSLFLSRKHLAIVNFIKDVLQLSLSSQSCLNIIKELFFFLQQC